MHPDATGDRLDPENVAHAKLLAKTIGVSNVGFKTFKHIVEIIGERVSAVPGYREGTVRSFIPFEENGSTYARVKPPG